VTDPDPVRGSPAVVGRAGPVQPAIGRRPQRSPGGDEVTSLVDLLDRVVHRGVVVTGDLVVSLAGIDLLRLDLRLLLTGVRGALAGGPGTPVEEA
jgi:hypothetical protein